VTRSPRGKAVEGPFWHGRLENARAFLQSARELADLAETGRSANPIVSLIVSAAIAYADALAASVRGTVSQDDHDAAPRMLRAALGNRLPAVQEKRFTRILREKDSAQYGARLGRLDRARELLAELEALAAWVETELRA